MKPPLILDYAVPARPDGPCLVSELNGLAARDRALRTRARVVGVTTAVLAGVYFVALLAAAAQQAYVESAPYAAAKPVLRVYWPAFAVPPLLLGAGAAWAVGVNRAARRVRREMEVKRAEMECIRRAPPVGAFRRMH